MAKPCGAETKHTRWAVIASCAVEGLSHPQVSRQKPHRGACVCFVFSLYSSLKPRLLNFSIRVLLSLRATSENLKLEVKYNVNCWVSMLREKPHYAPIPNQSFWGMWSLCICKGFFFFFPYEIKLQFEFKNSIVNSITHRIIKHLLC